MNLVSTTKWQGLHLSGSSLIYRAELETVCGHRREFEVSVFSLDGDDEATVEQKAADRLWIQSQHRGCRDCEAAWSKGEVEPDDRCFFAYQNCQINAAIRAAGKAQLERYREYGRAFAEATK